MSTRRLPGTRIPITPALSTMPDELLSPAGDEPDVWHNGGWVCRACGTPTDTVPCDVHQPVASAEMEAQQ